jgi:predicted nucleic acid-binding protein
MPDPGGSGGLVLDTSVWINLLATEAIEVVLAALAVPCYAPEQVVSELRRHPVTNTPFPADDHPLCQMSSWISVLPLKGLEVDVFLGIVGAPVGDALGDGEAAAIAIAASRGLDLVIDDRKARRILQQRFSHVRTWWTVDLLQASSVVAKLGRSLADKCFAKALQFGRMHVPRA